MGYCTNCGKALGNNIRYCGICGVKIESVTHAPSQVRAKPNDAVPIEVAKPINSKETVILSKRKRIILATTVVTLLVIGLSVLLYNIYFIPHSVVGRWEVVESISPIANVGDEFVFRPYAGIFQRSQGQGIVDISNGRGATDYMWHAHNGNMHIEEGQRLAHRWFYTAHISYSIMGSYLFFEVNTLFAPGGGEQHGGSLVLRRVG